MKSVFVTTSKIWLVIFFCRKKEILKYKFLEHYGYEILAS